MHKETSVNRRSIPGAGTLRFGRSVMKDMWFNGLMSQFNIYDRVPHSHAEIEEHIQMPHCCHDKLLSGNWLNWDTIIKYWTLNGTARIDQGADCTNFESKKTIFCHHKSGFKSYVGIWLVAVSNAPSN